MTWMSFILISLREHNRAGTVMLGNNRYYPGNRNDFNLLRFIVFYYSTVS